MNLLIILILSYLLGSIPTSIVVGRVFFHTDIREHGSGNAGGTNTVRVFGWKAGVPVILVDVAKGAAAVLWIAQLSVLDTGSAELLSHEATAVAAGAAAVCGHIWTVFASFKGGKGVATAAGMIAALYPLGFAAALLVFVLLVLSTGIVSVGSISAALLFPVLLYGLDKSGISDVSPFLLWVSIPIAILILFTHRKNIKRLLHGEEKRLFKKK